MAVSKAQQRATAKYIKANYDRMEIVVPKGMRDTIKAHAAAQGESVGAFIKRAIDHEMERDGLERPAGAAEGQGGIHTP